MHGTRLCQLDLEMTVDDLYEKYEQTIKDVTIARLINEEERLRDKWFDFVNVGHITINGKNLRSGYWQVSELFEDVSRIFRNY